MYESAASSVTPSARQMPLIRSDFIVRCAWSDDWMPAVSSHSRSLPQQTTHATASFRAIGSSRNTSAVGFIVAASERAGSVATVGGGTIDPE